jgi:DNA invertase Pin-like site-specific DNA recombinase
VATLDDLVRAYRRAENAVPAVERAAAARVKAAREARTAARLALAEGIVEAWRAGTPQAEIARRTGYSREQVRRILRAGGVEAESD